VATTVTVSELDPALTVSPGEIATAVMLPAIGLAKMASFSACCASVTFAVALSIDAWSEEIWLGLLFPAVDPVEAEDGSAVPGDAALPVDADEVAPEALLEAVALGAAADNALARLLSAVPTAVLSDATFC